MLKPNHIIICACLLLLRISSYAQYTGGSADGFSADKMTNITCGTPSQFYAYMGGSNDGFSVNTYTQTSCGTPAQFFAYGGGSGDGFSVNTLTLTTCGTPAQFFAYGGGSGDGFSVNTYTLTNCGTPAQFYAYAGGSGDGFSMQTYTLTNCGTPSQYYAYMGGSGDGFAKDTLTKCPSSPPVASFTASATTICAGSVVTFSDQSTNSPAAWAWTFQGGTPATSNVKNPTVTYNTPGTYSVNLVATNAIGSNTATAVNYITVNAIPNANAGSNVSICAGSSTTLTATGGTTYSWTPSTGLSATNIANPVANPTATTNYTVTATTNGCSSNASVKVTVNPIPVASAGSNTTICVGSVTTLTASGGTTYTWAPAYALSASTGAAVSASPTVTQVYTVTAASAGCSATATVLVNVNALPNASAGMNTAVCYGTSTNLSASGGVSYSWLPVAGLSAMNIPNPVATPSSTTNYTVSVIDGNNCTAKSVVTVSVNPLPVANAGNDVTICTGSSATLSASGGNTYAWTPATAISATNIANPVANPTVTTTYTVLVTDNNNCQASDAVVVNVTAALVANAGSDVSICTGSSANLSASGGATYSWTPSAGLSATNISNPTASPTVTTDYTVTVASGGCSASDAVKVTVNPLPVVSVTANGPTTFCAGDSVKLTASVGTAYAWSNGATTQTVTIKTQGNYYVTVTNSFSCSATSTVTAVTVHPLGTANISPSGSTVFCQGGSIILTANSGAAYNWSTGATTQTISVNASGTYTVSVTDVNGCPVTSPTAAISVTVNPNPPTPTITANGTTALCFGDTVRLSSDAANAYTWNTGAHTQTITVTSAGVYSVSVSNVYGCSAVSAATTVSVNDPLTDFTGSPLLVFLPNGAVSFTATVNGVSPYTYLWSFGDGSTSGAAAPTHTYNTMGYDTVKLKLTDATGCSKTISKPNYVEVEQLFPSKPMYTNTTLDLTSIDFLDQVKGVISLIDGNCILSTDSGNNWSPLPTGQAHPLKGVHVKPGRWFAVGEQGTILSSTDDGLTWVPYNTGTTETFNGCHFSTANDGFAVGTNGTIHMYSSGIWTPHSSGTSNHLNHVFAHSNGDAIAVGDNQTILSYNGSVWSPKTCPVSMHVKGVRFSTQLLGFAVGTNGNILQTTDGGNTWTPSLTGVDIDFNSIEASGPDTAWATGTHGIIYTTNDGGTNWVRYSVGYTNDQSCLRVVAGKGHIVGTAGNARNFNQDSTHQTTSVKGIGKVQFFETYPSPAQDHYYISGNLSQKEKLQIDIRDMQGRLIERAMNKETFGEFKLKINTDNYSDGIYFIHIQQGEKSWVQKIVVEK